MKKLSKKKIKNYNKLKKTKIIKKNKRKYSKNKKKKNYNIKSRKKKKVFGGASASGASGATVVISNSDVISHLLQIFKKSYNQMSTDDESSHNALDRLTTLEDAKTLILQTKKELAFNKRLFDKIRGNIQRTIEEDEFPEITDASYGEIGKLDPEYMFLFRQGIGKNSLLGDDLVKIFITLLSYSFIHFFVFGLTKQPIFESNLIKVNIEDKKNQYNELFKKHTLQKEINEFKANFLTKEIFTKFAIIFNCSGMMISLLKVRITETQFTYNIATSESGNTDFNYQKKIEFLKEFLTQFKKSFIKQKIVFEVVDSENYIEGRKKTRCYRPFVKGDSDTQIKCNSGSLCCESKLFHHYHTTYSDNKLNFACVAFWLNKDGSGHTNYRYKDYTKPSGESSSRDLELINNILAYPCPGCCLNYTSYLEGYSCDKDGIDPDKTLITKCPDIKGPYTKQNCSEEALEALEVLEA